MLTMAVVAALCSTVLLTAGRTEGSATAVLTSLDASGTRSIIVRAQPAAALDTSVLERLRPLRDVAWVAAFGPAEDVTNAAIPAGPRIALRPTYGMDDPAPMPAAPAPAAPAPAAPAPATPAPATQLPAAAVVTPEAARQLGLADGVGAVASPSSGTVWLVGGRLELPPDLRFLEPIVLAPAPQQHPPQPAAPSGTPGESPAGPSGTTGDHLPQPVAVLVVRATSPALVGPVAAAVTSLLGVDDPTTVTVETSEQLAAVRVEVEQQLGGFGRAMVLSSFGASAALVAAILYALVMLRRRDFGRRRALGAARSLVVTLLLAQTGMLATLGAAAGILGALCALAAAASPLPSPPFVAAVGVLAVLTSVVAAVLPAFVASTRDPLRELRVP
ncbi:lipoprotein ABC transporter permease [Subtercola sp. Z020]|nr:lipoprotein ABC transporter permease [Subtercola sp. Z020]